MFVIFPDLQNTALQCMDSYRQKIKTVGIKTLTTSSLNIIQDLEELYNSSVLSGDIVLDISHDLGMAKQECLLKVKGSSSKKHQYPGARGCRKNSSLQNY